jgi:hypothetical protein
VDEIAATKADVQHGGVTAALANAAVAIASLSPALALCGEEARSERQLCLRENKGIQQQQPWRAQLSPIRVLGKATDQK